MPDGTIGQTYIGTPALPGKMLKSDDSILNISELLELMLTAMQNIDIDIDSVNINTDEVESLLDQIRVLTIDTNNLIAAGNVDLAALEVLVTASNALLTTIDADTGGILTAVEIIDNIVATPGSAFTGDVAAIGGPAESTVPTARADREGVEAWLNIYGQFVNPSHDLATGTDLVTDASPAQMQKQFETGWAALTAPDDETPVLNVEDYENLTVAYIISIGGVTDVDLIIWGSLDNTNWFPMWTDNITSAEDLTDAIIFSGIAIKYIKCEFEAENGDTDATVTFQVAAGN